MFSKNKENIYKETTKDAGTKEALELNLAIRKKLSEDSINMIGKIADEISKVLWNDINKRIIKMTAEIFEIPEIRIHMKVNNETIVKRDIIHCFDSLIQNLARPAISLFLSQPRGNTRINLLRMYDTELMVLGVFIEDGKRNTRDIVQFIANGKHGVFPFKVINPNNCDNKSKICASNKPLELTASNKIDTKTEKKTQSNTQAESGFNFLRRFSKNKKQDSEKNNLPNENKTNNNEDNFEKLTISDPCSNSDQVFVEIEEDFNAFLLCMKNSVFYGSMIRNFYSQELHKYRRKFLESRGLCYLYVSK
jgi:hypothetical protein